MQASAQVGRLRRPARWRFPERTLHLVDIENLAGTGAPTLPQVSEVQGLYLARLGFGADDQVVMAASHLGLLNAALAWPHARYRVRSGRNGADLELIDVLLHEDIPTRFTHVVIGSGDGLFVRAVAGLTAGGVRVTVASRPESLSHHLRHAASDVVYLDVPHTVAALPQRRLVSHRLLTGHREFTSVTIRLGTLKRMYRLSASVADYFRAVYQCAGTGHALDDVRVFPSSDELCGEFGARALTVGSDIHFRTGEFAPHTSDGFWLLAHEVAHVVQQRRGPVTALPHSAGLGVGPVDAPEEKEASAAADAALAGKPFFFAPGSPGAPDRPGVPDRPGASARQPSSLVIQRYMAWEHLILGTAGPEEAGNVFAEASATQTGTTQTGPSGHVDPVRQAAHIGQEAPVGRPAHAPHAGRPSTVPSGIASPSVLSAYCELLEDLGRDPENVAAAEIADRHPGTPVVTLPGSGLVVTLGELCILPDYLSRPEDIEDAPKSFVLPLIQSTREWNIREMRRAADGTPPKLRDRPRLKQTLAYPSLGGIAELAEGVQVTRLGGRCGFPPWERYQSVVSRNAGHFAPFSWYRWQDHHLQARRLARQACVTKDQERKAILTARAWICAGYADHFLQDSFAAGHLINKTLVMQWYAESLVSSRLPVPGRQHLAALTTAAQPGMHGPGHYQPVPDAEDPDRLVPSPTPGAPAVTDPQSMVEAATLGERIAASGVTGRDDIERTFAYVSYLTMLRSSVVQSAAGSIHGYFNDNSLVVAAGDTGDRYPLWGDWTMLRGVDTGVRAARAGQLSRQAIEDILAHGETPIASRRIFALFPDHVEVGGALLALPEWHSGQLRDQCFGEFFRKPSTRVMRAATTIVFPHLGVPSADSREVSRPGSRRDDGKEHPPAGWPEGDRGGRTAQAAGRSAK